jgi:hybrid cluster-associated redox disulfide protein
MAQRNEITEDTTLADVMARPGAIQILAKYGLPCLACPMAAFEIGKLKIGAVARAYGIDAADLIKELNQKIEELQKKKEGEG